MGKYQAYPEYRGSEIEWIGHIPSHWKVLSLKRTVDGCTNGIWGSEPDDTNDIVVLRVADFDRNNLGIREDKLTYRAILPNERNNRLLKKGDLLIEKSGGGDKTLVGCVVLFDKDFPAVTSNFVAKMTPKKGFESRFLKYAFALLYSGRVNFPSIKQTTGIQNLDSDSYLMEPFCFPVEQEQTQIANFLDHETAKIDTLIEKQQQLIKLLKEKRQAVISHAVTKGLNPQAPMKDSGVEWLGEVPEHWDIKKAKYLFDFVTSGSRGWAEYYADSGSLFFRIANLTRDTVEPKLSSIQCVQPPKGAEGERSKIRLNDLLISITADLGSVCVANQSIANGYVSQHVALCRPNNQMVKSSRWLAYFVLSDTAKEQLLGSGYGGTKVQLSLEDIRELVIAFPPQEEQLQIEAYIDTKLSQFENLMQKAYMQVELLQERRTALISAAVTGKIDVRNWQAPTSQNQELEQTA
ncbi:restriction endonuclease subunit S [Vibrio parahaemolyticus]|nr:restriction endonuclease subunit S [Vibrio parahaemolyticus]EIY8173254.1 restriction endonuclease subunit S [Vibrio parahaemolyticus]EIY8251044.1 restriction endonuclease subunit S [Vibrio parahaemolyticus]